MHSSSFLVGPLRRVVLGRHDETDTLLRTPVDGLQDVDQILLIVDFEVQFVVVARAEIHL